MVSVRGAHQHIDEHYAFEQFDFEKWARQELPLVNSAAFDKFKAVWDFCFENSAGSEKQLTCFHNAIEMIEILSTLNMDVDSLCAALLFPFLEAKVIRYDDLKEDIDKQIVQLASGVIRMKGIGQLRAIRNGSATPEQIDSIRRMLLAMVKDFRSVIIKLAERIMFLRDMLGATEEERILAAKECENIYAPLANRLGIGQLKWELEDFCFRYLHPDEYRVIAKKLQEKRIDRERYIDHFVRHLQALMDADQIKAEVYGRPKHIYSIWRKMQKKSLSFDQLYDIRAVRVIADRIEDCYAALGIIHSHYKHIATEFDDYVANPKPNGYQSIHTVILGPTDKTIEIQIRTKQMHNDAELGVAAHWKYKEGSTDKMTAYDQRIIWLRKLLAWQEEMSDSTEMRDEIRSQVFDDRVYVFTPKGDVVDLPSGSTPLDFAYHIHSDIGHRCIGAKIGGRIVPFTYILQMGDQIEVITQKQPNPSRDWLNPSLGFVNSSRARAKIQAWFKKQDRDKNIQAGRQILDNELSQIGISVKDVEKLLIDRYNAHSFDEVLASVGGGDIRINQLVNYVNTKLNKPTAEQEDEAALKQLNQKAENSQQRNQRAGGQIIVEGLGNLMYSIARCCSPIPGDDIVGFITQGRGISIHRANCEQLIELKGHAPERIVDAVWGSEQDTSYQLIVRIVAHDRSGLLRDITTILANEKVNVLGVSSRTDTKQQTATIDMDMQVYNQEALNRVLSKLNQLPDVIEARRFSG
ncbi:GTP diphosphokinase [Utexia brackfieldae]|uniref:GTP diphosphokinase n=1 Tax=Utexia brackfieldae TaxID=3074108 RepID=UPI00370D88FC